MKKTIILKSVCILMTTVILVLTLIPGKYAEATSQTSQKYISVNSFIEELVQELKLEIKSEADNSYIDAAITEGIVKEGDFTNYSDNITRTDAAVLINRVDEYLHGDKVKEKLLNFVLKKRISDINKIPEAKREAVAKVFAKGIIKGYGNGYYIQNRSFKGNELISEATAKSYINLITNTSKRAKLSPDGELIRTTNLPKNAKRFDYILACYPNKFYEKSFTFMLGEGYTDSTRNKEFNIYPVEMKNKKFKTWNDEWPLTDEMDKYLYDWTEKAETYLNYIFNVDYRTVDNKWIKGLASCFVKGNVNFVDDINYYLDNMKKNKVIIKSSIIAVEPSTFYDDGSYHMRAYVRYKITAKDISVKQSKLIYAQYPYFKNLKSGVWRDGVFDVRFGTNNGTWGDGSYFAINNSTFLYDEYQLRFLNEK